MPGFIKRSASTLFFSWIFFGASVHWAVAELAGEGSATNRAPTSSTGKGWSSQHHRVTLHNGHISCDFISELFQIPCGGAMLSVGPGPNIDIQGEGCPI